MAIRSDEVVVQLDERLPDPFFRYPDDPSHQDHEREKDFGNQASEFMRQKDILPSDDREDQQETAGDHEKDEKGKDEAEEQGQGRMNVSQPHHGNIPEKEDETEENNTRQDE
jgi:hypothetical protein